MLPSCLVILTENLGGLQKKRFDVKLAPQLLTLLVPFLELNERTNQQKMKQAQLEF